jgi:hypothetical protein
MCPSPSSGGVGGEASDVPVGSVDWCAGDGCPQGECDQVFGDDCDVVYPCGVDVSSIFCSPGASSSYCLTVVNTRLDYTPSRARTASRISRHALAGAG